MRKFAPNAPRFLIAVILAMAVFACTSPPAPEPTETLDIEATITAAVAAALPTSTLTPTQTPTPAPDLPATITVQVQAQVAATIAAIAPTLRTNTAPSPTVANPPRSTPAVPLTTTPTRQATLTALPPKSALGRVESLQWIADGISENEFDAADTLYQIAQFRPRLAEAILDKQYVMDGLTISEHEVVKSISAIAQGGQGPDWERDQEQALKGATEVLEMPFLRSIDTTDAGAANALAGLSLMDRDKFKEVLNHPRFDANGITDQDTMWVWMLNVAYIADANNPGEDLYQTALQDNLPTQTQSIDLAISGNVTLTVIALGNHGEWIPLQMARLKESVRVIEDIMQHSYPTNQITLILTEGGGAYYGKYMTLPPRYLSTTHETAHYYWGIQFPSWISEGAAEMIVDISRGHNPASSSRGCGYPGKGIEEQPTILQMEEYKRTTGLTGSRVPCTYAIGEGMFDDLYAILGRELFLDRFRELFHLSDHTGTRAASPVEICDFQKIFTAGLRSDRKQAVLHDIAKWYGDEPACKGGP